MMKNSTLDHYNRNTETYIDNTFNVDFRQTQNIFLSYMSQKSYILDFGCGSGRDAKYFHDMGYSVDAVDGCEKMCISASKLTGLPVKKMLFEQLDEINKYDGIWACASILHLPKEELGIVFEKMKKALKDKGYIHTSFKYGNHEGMIGERYFTFFTETGFEKFIAEIDGLTVERSWISEDVRTDRKTEKWLNLILRKI